MGLKGIHLSSLILIFFIFIMLFGTKRLREMGNDIGSAVRNFRKSMQEDETKSNVSDKNE